METTIHQIIERVAVIKTSLGIHQELKRLEAIQAEKIKKIEADEIDFSYELRSQANEEVDAFKEKYGHLLSIFPELEETFEELEVFEEEFTSEEKAVRLTAVNKAMNTLEVYYTRKELGLPIDTYSIEHCTVGYEKADKFFQYSFGYPVPKGIKADEPVFTSDRSSWDIRKCHNFLSCKKQAVCPHHTAHYLYTESTFGKLIFFSTMNMEQFFKREIPDYYFIGYASNDNFYYIRADHWRKYYIRFHTGSAYSAWDSSKESAGKFLQSFLRFEELVRGKIDYLELRYSLTISIKIKKGNLFLEDSIYTFLENFDHIFDSIAKQIDV